MRRHSFRLPTPPSLTLGVGLIIPYLLLFFAISAPLIAYYGWYQPGSWSQYITLYDDPEVLNEVYFLCSILFIIPLLWVVISRTLDQVALAFAQQSLMIGGYFYLDQTTQRIQYVNEDVIETAGLTVQINLTGFICVFVTLGLVYHLLVVADIPLKVIPSGKIRDERLSVFFRFLAIGCSCAIALPMVLSGKIPLLQGGEDGDARLELTNSDLGRSVYNMGTALLPFVVGTLIVFVLRQPKRLLGGDGVLIAAPVFLQLLTTNRAPLSVTLMVTLCLTSMHFRFPRIVLAFIVITYLLSFSFLSGFSSLLRTNPAALAKEDWVNASFQEAYLGDNIIDLRDGSWVLSQWDFKPLLGRTYMGGAFSLVPSGIFPMKKQWHLGLTGVRIVGMPEEEHFGLRVSFFGESFLNFGWGGVICLGVLLGSLFGVTLRQVHLSSMGDEHCLTRNILLLVTLDAIMPLANTSDGYITWVELALIGMIYTFVIFPERNKMV